jgi:hypothetical protein
MCKETPVIPVNRVVDKKRIIGKMEGQGRGEAQGVADQKDVFKTENLLQVKNNNTAIKYIADVTPSTTLRVAKAALSIV